MAFESQQRANAYWDKNVKLMISLMVVWFVVSFGCGILFVDALSPILFNALNINVIYGG